MALQDRERAAFALKRVRTVVSSADRARYRTWLVKLPTHLHVNGLGQTVAFYLADKPGTVKPVICGWLGDWLLSEKARVYGTGAAGSTLIDRVVGEDDVAYRRASAEARAMSLWLKRFAEAFLRPVATDTKTETETETKPASGTGEAP
jgi:CRISPR type III-B/RAMP module-associated protein Cmr5